MGLYNYILDLLKLIDLFILIVLQCYIMISDINKSILGFEISLAVSTNIKEKLLKRLEAIVSEAQG